MEAAQHGLALTYWARRQPDVAAVRSDVGDVATIGKPNPEWGEEVLAVVQVAPGSGPSPALAAELLAFCRERLAGFKCPRSIEFIEVLPRYDNGKLYRRVLRDRYRCADPAAAVRAPSTDTTIGSARGDRPPGR